jgi:acyl carrier protein
MDVEAEVRAIVMKRLAAPVEIVADTKLADIGLDSLDVVEIAFEIEDKFKIQLAQNNLELTSVTFRELCALVEQHLVAGDKPAQVVPQAT